ncbi:MAG TPA: hypothetical protein VJX16_26860 [Terriglobales bacterium]|nr:hypothetical protein [Terriglobales bacterium]
MRHASFFAILTVLVALPVSAQQSAQSASGQPDYAALLQKIRDLEDRVISLEGQVLILKSQQVPPAQPAPATAPAEAGAQAATAAPQGQEAVPGVPAATSTAAAPMTQEQAIALGGAGGAAAKALNPDISAIGDFISVAGHNPLQPSPSLEMHESEVGFQAIIDPYARGDFFLTFGEEGVGLEEGYITFTALPAGIVARVGKMRAAFGKVNTLHNHVLPWVDRPLVTNSLVGGEDGIDDAGVSVQRILPAPKWLFLEATGQLFRGDSGNTKSPLFKASTKSDVSAVAHLRSYKDVTESTNLDIGFSYARGHNDLGTNFLTQLYGIDATLRWRPLRRSIYHSFVARSEFIWSQRQQLPFEQRAFGFYSSGDYQLGRRWFVGGRYDHSDRPESASLTDNGASAVLTYWPSEFSQVRGQYRFTRYSGNLDAHELLMQVMFSLGAHGAHPF